MSVFSTQHNPYRRPPRCPPSGDSGILDVRVLFLSGAASPPRSLSQLGVDQVRKVQSSRQFDGPEASVSAPRSPAAPHLSRGSSSAPTSSGRQGSSTERDLAAVSGVRAAATVTVSEAVMKKLTGLDNVDGIDAVAELDLPAPVDFSRRGECAHSFTSEGMCRIPPPAAPSLPSCHNEALT